MIDPLYSSIFVQRQRPQLDISKLEKRIDELIALCAELERKHETISAKQNEWAQERTRLMEKNEQAKTKIEAMIMRLKSLEQD